jgi:hypothetical protein
MKKRKFKMENNGEVLLEIYKINHPDFDELFIEKTNDKIFYEFKKKDQNINQLFFPENLKEIQQDELNDFLKQYSVGKPEKRKLRR